MVQILLSEKEMDRLCALRQVKDRQLTQEEAGQRLKLTSRQIRRLLKQVEHGDSQGIKRHKVGGNRTFPDDFKVSVMEVVKTTYADFRTTLCGGKTPGTSGIGC